MNLMKKPGIYDKELLIMPLQLIFEQILASNKATVTHLRISYFK